MSTIGKTTEVGSTKETVFREVEEMFGLVPEWVRQIPEPALAGFWGLEKDFYLAETKIPNKYKELIGVAVSGATRCRYCALFHTEGARLHGATDEEIAEASTMASVTMMASTFLNAQQVDYAQFKTETLEIIDYVKKQLAAGDVARKGDVGGKSERQASVHA
jgi:AhpD family alkylhydroperoxidase